MLSVLRWAGAQVQQALDMAVTNSFIEARAPRTCPPSARVLSF